MRGEATGQSASSSSGAQGASTSSSSTRAPSAVNKVTVSARQQPTTSRHGKKSQRGKRSTRGPLPPLPPPPCGPPFPYDGDAHGMWQTLHWQKDLMIEKGSFTKDDLALNCQQRFIMRDLIARQRTAELTEAGFREYVSKLPPLASSKEELRTLLFPEGATPMETDTAAPSTSTEHESSTPSERCVASPVEPEARSLGKCLLDAYPRCTPVRLPFSPDPTRGCPHPLWSQQACPHRGPLTPPPRSGELPDSPTLAECQLGSHGAPSLSVPIGGTDGLSRSRRPPSLVRPP